MTACFKLMKALHSNQSPPATISVCESCVYFSKNLDKTEYGAPFPETDECGLGFHPGDGGCTEMRTDNCSTRKRQAGSKLL